MHINTLSTQLFWIPTKTLNFSNHCFVVKTHEQRSLPASPLNGIKLKLINQWIYRPFLLDPLQVFATLRYSSLHHRLFVVFDCRRLMWITGDCVSLHLNAICIPPNILQISAENLKKSGPDRTRTANRMMKPWRRCPVGAGGFNWGRAELDAAHSRSTSIQEPKAPNYTEYLIDGTLQSGHPLCANGRNPPFHNNPTISRLSSLGAFESDYTGSPLRISGLWWVRCTVTTCACGFIFLPLSPLREWKLTEPVVL